MKKELESFCHALETLEKEIGTDALGQLLAECLLACSARTVGDESNSWTVKSSFVSGEVSAITEKGLSNQTLSDIS